MKKHLFAAILFSMLCLPVISQEIPKLRLKSDSLKELSLSEKCKKDSIKLFSFDTLRISKDSIPQKIQRPMDMEKFKQLAEAYHKNSVNNLPVVVPPEGNYSLIVVAPDTTVHFHLRNGFVK